MFRLSSALESILMITALALASLAAVIAISALIYGFIGLLCQ